MINFKEKKMKAIALKLVLRSWWRNKTFSVISIISLAIGIACTNLLATFVVHEYNVESGNPARNRIYLISQDNPMKSGEKSCIAGNTIPSSMKEKYSEVENFLRIDTKSIRYLTVGGVQHEPMALLAADSTFTRFFPTEVISGSLEEALTKPGKIALTEKVARRLFGTSDPIGQLLTCFSPEDTFKEDQSTAGETLQVAAVIREREQSYLHFEALTRLDTSDPYNFPVAFILTNRTIDSDTLAKRMKDDKIPTIQGEIGRYYFDTLHNSYFNRKNDGQTFMNRRQPILLYVGGISALLILLIACFNYINLNFSRLLQQVKMIHTQKLMGADGREINRQLFLDTFLTVIIAFLLSLLIMHDLLPLFNSIVSGRMTSRFFFNPQVLSMIGIFIGLLSIIPAYYLSRKVTRLSASSYRAFFTGNKKRRIITALSIAQYVISIGLVIATLTVNAQICFIRQGGNPYEGLIEIGNWREQASYIRPLAAELKQLPDIESVALAGTSLLQSWIRQMTITDEKGNESFYSQINYSGGVDILDVLQIEVTEGLLPAEAVVKYARPVYINRQFAKLVVPKDENPVGKPIQTYDKYFFNNLPAENGTTQVPVTTIAGIIEDIYTETLENEVCPITIQINNSDNNNFLYLYVRLGKDRVKSLASVRQAWTKVNPGKYFNYTDVYDTFMQRNRKTSELSNLLLMYALISLFLTSCGLFGMALYATRQRIKEIGIRKVNGATSLQIMLLLNRQFIQWIGIAFAIAVPISWYLMNKWLENFVYRTTLSIGIFVSAAIVVLLITLLTVSWHSYKAASGNPVDSLSSE